MERMTTMMLDWLSYGKRSEKNPKKPSYSGGLSLICLVITLILLAVPSVSLAQNPPLLPPGSLPSDPRLPGAPRGLLPPNAIPLPGQPGLPGALQQPLPGLNQPVSPTQTGFPLRLSARLKDDLPPLSYGVVWRIYDALPQDDGAYQLVQKSDVATPVLYLNAGNYIVHASYGRSSVAEFITMAGAPNEKEVVLNAGGLRLALDLGRGQTALPQNVSLSIFSSQQDEFGERQLIVPRASLGRVIRLSEGTYHIFSQYGDANAVVRADVRVEAGKITDATVKHHAGITTLKLVYEPGGEALANTAWSVLTPGGDVVSESMGAFPNVVLSEGEYEAVARHEGNIFNRTFTVETGVDREVEVMAQ